MTIAAFVLGVLGFGVASLTWQVYTFLIQGARPKLTPVVGMLTPGGMVTNDATHDVRTSLVSAAGQLSPGPLIVGVKVVNAGRAPFHIAEWTMRADPRFSTSCRNPRILIRREQVCIRGHSTLLRQLEMG